MKAIRSRSGAQDGGSVEAQSELIELSVGDSQRLAIITDSSAGLTPAG